MSEMEIGIVEIGAGLLVLALIIFAVKYVYDQQNQPKFLKRTITPAETENEVVTSPSRHNTVEEFDPSTVKEVDAVSPSNTVSPSNHEKIMKEYEAQDSLDEHLNALTQKLADKEGRLQLSKTKIRETQHEIQSLHDIDQQVKTKYRDIMETLKKDLMQNEQDCKKLQEQIEWVSMRRAELKEEIRQGQMMYGMAAAELAKNLVELQRGRLFEKPQGEVSFSEQYSGLSTTCGLRNRKEPQLPSASVTASSIFNHDTLISPKQLDSIDLDTL